MKLSLLLLGLLAAGCSDPSLVPSDGHLPVGTYGGDNAGLIVTDAEAHVHVGCTFGDMPGNIPLDAEGRCFKVMRLPSGPSASIEVGAAALPTEVTETIKGKPASTAEPSASPLTDTAVVWAVTCEAPSSKRRVKVRIRMVYLTGGVTPSLTRI